MRHLPARPLLLGLGLVAIALTAREASRADGYSAEYGFALSGVVDPHPPDPSEIHWTAVGGSGVDVLTTAMVYDPVARGVLSIAGRSPIPYRAGAR